MNINSINQNLDGKGLSIGIVVSRFNDEIGQIELDYCLEELLSLGVSESDIILMTVPGALEIGVTMLHLIENREIDALIALGAVIRGETFHFDIVSNEMASAISTLSLQSGIPIANGVLTVDSYEQANVRAAEKGRDCADAAVEMANLIQMLKS
ncbi:MAG: 6,7-dimethyl-8-ribityllumazine synthase [Candidatus Kinetoplastibacterium crithidii]|nr:MAG: 6,7-dimethyl-8-ribityllumazine synthase [Candidatus Kinetoplastibacterium crithidii]